MIHQQSINTDSYWNTRFANDWETLAGPIQSRFFSRLAIENLPRWLIDQLQHSAFTLADWGCAQGDGTDVWASYIDARKIVGIDFSNVAIEQAKKRYPALRFATEDWLSHRPTDPDIFDVVFSSNTLEHLHEPYIALNRLCERASKAVVLALPYKEWERGEEHFFTFLPDNIPAKIHDDFRLVWSRVVDCRPYQNTPWAGDQVILVYAKSSWIDTLGLSLGDLRVEQIDAQSEVAALTRAINERDARIVNHDRLIAERDEQISNFVKLMTERDGKILDMEKDLNSIKLSRSWRIALFLRSTKSVFVSPKRSAYSLLRFFYQKLPAGLRQALHGPRHAFVRYFRGLPVTKAQADSNSTLTDLNWSDFNRKILSGRNNYKGIFIQELVIDWNVPLYQRPQHIAAAMGRLGYLVIYRTDNWAGDNVNGFREVSKNVWITNRHEVDEITDVIRSIYSTAYANTPELLLANGKRGRIIYEYIDHIDPEISGDQENIRRPLSLKDFAFKGGADLVIASAKKLYDEAANKLGPNRVILVPNGVDTRHYRDPRHLLTVIPESLFQFKKNHRALVGYFGALAPWLWYDVIADLSKQRPDLGFVFIGPDYYGGSAKLPKEKNVLYMGTIEYKALPAYAQQFDICFIPFKPGDIAKTTSPLKLFEYFALEKPVVVTSDMDECTAYPEVFRGGSVEELSLALDSAFNVKDSDEFKSKLRELADKNDWIERAQTMEDCFK